ncbi:hypothetical protein [Bernardetia sp.]|uniref:hypothetical protein n=1 Tax=Bernardetia sp. TaxID=1937974 RepID=UPI0025BDACC9|nr:hypothetical protein [Bernardetia sp.]
MTIHTLEKEKHSDFLTQNRIDPITGDVLQEGDSVVICASCKSAFLADSWEYMGRRHCEQSITLKKIPNKKILLAKKSKVYPKKTISVKLIGNRKAAEKISIPFSILLFFSYILLYINYSMKGLNFLYGFIFLAMIERMANLVLWITQDYGEYLDIQSKKLSLSLNDKEWENNIPIDSIDSIDFINYYKSKKYWFYKKIQLEDDKIYTLVFFLKDKTKLKFLLTKEELNTIGNKTNLLNRFDRGYILSSAFN